MYINALELERLIMILIENRRVLGLKVALKGGFLLLLAWILGDENDDRRAI